MVKRWSIIYAEGEEREPKLERWHESPQAALSWCERNDVPPEVVRITEWDSNDEDEILGTVSLETFVQEENRDALSILELV